MTQHEICNHLDNVAMEILTRLPENIRDRFKKQMYFAGGCIYCLRNDKTPKDYDVFLLSDELITELQTLDIWSYKSEYALTVGKYQVVIKYFGDPKECVGEFDFRHNMHYYIPFTDQIMTCNEEECENDFDDWEYLTTNELIFNENRARNIEHVLLRIGKFTERGMYISNETRKKIRSRTTRKAVRECKKTMKTHGTSCY